MQIVSILEGWGNHLHELLREIMMCNIFTLLWPLARAMSAGAD